MPTYQYACTECGHAFEQFQSFSDDALTVCPRCEGRLRKVYNAVGVVFKGSGFYRTDSRTDGPGKDGDGGKQAAAKDGTGTGTGKEAAAAKDTGSSSTGDGGSSTPSKTGGAAATAGSGGGSGTKAGSSSAA